jgi:hypothetical protein
MPVLGAYVDFLEMTLLTCQFGGAEYQFFGANQQAAAP